MNKYIAYIYNKNRYIQPVWPIWRIMISRASSWIKSGVELMIMAYFRSWRSTKWAKDHYLNICWPSVLRNNHATRSRWVIHHTPHPTPTPTPTPFPFLGELASSDKASLYLVIKSKLSWHTRKWCHWRSLLIDLVLKSAPNRSLPRRLHSVSMELCSTNNNVSVSCLYFLFVFSVVVSSWNYPAAMRPASAFRTCAIQN